MGDGIDAPPAAVEAGPRRFNIVPESPTAPGRNAVFLSYASQDAEAAKRMCEALRAAGIEVWFDQNELVGGDAWDGKIRKQIAECALFVPVVSAATQARREGYFRIEWRIAAQRTHAMADGTPFLLPVVIDDTRDADALVPVEFKAVQWTRLPGGETPAAFCARAKRILSGENETRPDSRFGGSPAASTRAEGPPKGRKGVWPTVLIASAAVLGAALLYFAGSFRKGPPDRAGSKEPSAAEQAAAPGTPRSEARKLVVQARQLFEEGDDANRQNLFTAEDLLKRALALDSTDGEVWAAQAQLSVAFEQFSYDRTPARREARQMQAERALKLAPESFEAELAYARHLGMVRTPAAMAEAISRCQSLIAKRPTDSRARWALVYAMATSAEHFEEALAECDRAAALPGGDPFVLALKAVLLMNAGRCAEAEQAVTAGLSIRPVGRLLVAEALLKLCWQGDLDGAVAGLNRWPAWLFLEDRGAFTAASVWLWRGEHDRALAVLRAVPRDYFQDHFFTGPRSALVAIALELAGRPDAAQEEWTRALQVAEAARANDDQIQSAATWRAVALSKVGNASAAATAFRSLVQNGRGGLGRPGVYWWPITVLEPGYAALGRPEEALPAFQRFAINTSGVKVQYPRAALQLNPAFANFRKDARFADLLATAAAPAASATAEDRKSATTEKNSVAILAFKNLSADKQSDFLADGISEELSFVLGKLPGLKVVAGSSSSYFKDRTATPREKGTLLGVAHLVEGSVQPVGSQVRVIARLTRTDTGDQIWTDRFEGEANKPWALQEQIATKIAQELKLKVVGSARATKTINPDAYRLILQGRRQWELRTFAGFDQAERVFREAEKLEPDSALVHVGLADVYAMRGWYRANGGLSHAEEYVLARRASERALALDPEVPGIYTAPVILAFAKREWPEAERLVRKALAQAPNDPLAHDQLGDLYMFTGRLEAAMRSYEQAASLDPLAYYILRDLVHNYLHAHRYREALEVATRAMTLVPDDFRMIQWRAWALAQMGARDEAVKILRGLLPQWHREQEPQSSMPEAVYYLRKLGLESESVALAEHILARVDQKNFLRGYTFVARGRLEEGLPFLNPCPSGHLQRVYWSPLFDDWRDDERFKRAIVQWPESAAYAVARESLAQILKTPAAAK